MNCDEIREFLSAYIDNECQASDKIMVEEHISACKTCREELELLKSIVSNLNNIEELDVPDHYHEDLMNKLEMLMPSKKNRWNKLKQRSSLIAAALILVITIAVFGSGSLFDFSMKKSDESLPRIESAEFHAKEETNTAMLATAAQEQNDENEVTYDSAPQAVDGNSEDLVAEEDQMEYGSTEVQEKAAGIMTVTEFEGDVSIATDGSVYSLTVGESDSELSTKVQFSEAVEGNVAEVEDKGKLKVNPFLIGILIIAGFIVIVQILRIRKKK